MSKATISKTQLIFTLLGTSVFSICLFYFMFFQTDSPSFINAVELLLGESSQPDRLFRLSKPLSLFFPTCLYYFFEIPIQYGFFIQQLLAYWLSAFVLYKIVFFVTSKDYLAYLAMLAYTLCQPMAVYGLAILTDGLGWFWMLWGVLWSLKCFCSPKLSWRHIAFLGGFMGIGFFIKESIIITGMFTFFLILLHPHHTPKIKITIYAVLGSFFLGTFLIGNYLIDSIWGISIWDWIKFGHSDPPAFYWKSFIAQSYHTIDLYWFLFLVGLFKNIAFRQWTQIYAALFLTFVTGWFLLPFFWPYLYDRILFMLVPFLIVWVAFGAHHFKRLALPLVLLAGATNLIVAFLIYQYQISGLITISACLYILLLVLIHFRQISKSS